MVKGNRRLVYGWDVGGGGLEKWGVRCGAEESR